MPSSDPTRVVVDLELDHGVIHAHLGVPIALVAIVVVAVIKLLIF